MARLTMAQAYAYARQAGFDPAGATVMAAIAMAESGLVTNARGDEDKTNSYWGPSVGLAQIRTVKSETGTGADRDITRLDDPLQNMIAAYNISHKGKDFSPWTTYTSGKFRKFLGQSTAAGAATAGGSVQGVGLVDGLDAGGITGRLQETGLLLLAIAVGGTLVVLGGVKALGLRPVGAAKTAMAAAL